jgi:hypothetical protein
VENHQNGCQFDGTESLPNFGAQRGLLSTEQQNQSAVSKANVAAEFDALQQRSWNTQFSASFNDIQHKSGICTANLPISAIGQNRSISDIQCSAVNEKFVLNAPSISKHSITDAVSEVSKSFSCATHPNWRLLWRNVRSQLRSCVTVSFPLIRQCVPFLCTLRLSRQFFHMSNISHQLRQTQQRMFTVTSNFGNQRQSQQRNKQVWVQWQPYWGRMANSEQENQRIGGNQWTTSMQSEPKSTLKETIN